MSAQPPTQVHKMIMFENGNMQTQRKSHYVNQLEETIEEFLTMETKFKTIQTPNDDDRNPMIEKLSEIEELWALASSLKSPDEEHLDVETTIRAVKAKILKINKSAKSDKLNKASDLFNSLLFGKDDEVKWETSTKGKHSAEPVQPAARENSDHPDGNSEPPRGDAPDTPDEMHQRGSPPPGDSDGSDDESSENSSLSSKSAKSKSDKGEPPEPDDSSVVTKDNICPILRNPATEPDKLRPNPYAFCDRHHWNPNGTTIFDLGPGMTLIHRTIEDSDKLETIKAIEDLGNQSVQHAHLIESTLLAVEREGKTSTAYKIRVSDLVGAVEGYFIRLREEFDAIRNQTDEKLNALYCWVAPTNWAGVMDLIRHHKSNYADKKPMTFHTNGKVTTAEGSELHTPASDANKNLKSFGASEEANSVKWSLPK